VGPIAEEATLARPKVWRPREGPHLTGGGEGMGGGGADPALFHIDDTTGPGVGPETLTDAQKQPDSSAGRRALTCDFPMRWAASISLLEKENSC
jgi:hypothetical protein